MAGFGQIAYGKRQRCVRLQRLAVKSAKVATDGLHVIAFVRAGQRVLRTVRGDDVVYDYDERPGWAADLNAAPAK